MTGIIFARKIFGFRTMSFLTIKNTPRQAIKDHTQGFVLNAPNRIAIIWDAQFIQIFYQLFFIHKIFL